MEVSKSLGHGPSRLLVLDFKAGLIAKGASPELTLQAIAVTTRPSLAFKTINSLHLGPNYLFSPI